MDKADIDRLRSLAAMMKPLAELPAMLDRALSADQAVREAEMHAERIAAENLDTMQTSARIRDEIAAARIAASAAEAACHEKCALAVAEADRRAKLTITSADSTAKQILRNAHEAADAAQREADTIDQRLTEKRAELERLDAKAQKVRDYLKKMAGE